MRFFVHTTVSLMCLAACYGLAVVAVVTLLAEGGFRRLNGRLFDWMTAAEAAGRRYHKLMEAESCPTATPKAPTGSS